MDDKYSFYPVVVGTVAPPKIANFNARRKRFVFSKSPLKKAWIVAVPPNAFTTVLYAVSCSPLAEIGRETAVSPEMTALGTLFETCSKKVKYKESTQQPAILFPIYL